MRVSQQAIGTKEQSCGTRKSRAHMSNNLHVEFPLVLNEHNLCKFEFLKACWDPRFLEKIILLENGLDVFFPL